MRVLLTGMSGAGKSTLVAELRRRGLSAVDVDDDGFSESRVDGRWGWRAEAVKDLLTEPRDGLFFVAGCSEEQRDMPFERRVVLTAPASVLADRLKTRMTKSYGASEPELAQVLADLCDIEPLLRESADLILDSSTASVAKLADQLLNFLSAG